MIADIHITEKSFGDKSLMKNIKFSVDDGEKIGIVGRNGVGKSTLFGILAGADKDFTGEVVFRRGATVASTAQEHHGLGEVTVLEYVLSGLPEYANLRNIIDTYPEEMADNMRLIDEYTEALARFDDKGFYQIEEKIERELSNFQLENVANRPLKSLSGGQKRLIEIVKIMHSDAHLALIDEPTNHMDYVAKQQFIDWMKSEQAAQIAMLVITHDRDVLAEVDRIVELKDGECVSYRGNYDAYLRQNATTTAAGMNNFEQIEKRITNLKQKVLDYQRLKEKSRNPSTIQKFKRLEMESRAELAELQEKEKPTFWIDKSNVAALDYRAAARYDKFKAKNIRMNIKNEESRSKHVLVRADDVALGYGDEILFEGVNIDLREGEAVELRGRNGAGKTTLIKALLGSVSLASSPTKFPEMASRPTSLEHASRSDGVADISENLLASGSTALSSPLDNLPDETIAARLAERDAFVSEGMVGEGVMGPEEDKGSLVSLPVSSSRATKSAETSAALLFDNRREAVSGDFGGEAANEVAPLQLYSGELFLDKHARIGIYEQEIDEKYLDDTLEIAIEKLYLSRNLPISDTKIRQLLADYLFTEADRATPLSRLSGGQKSRFQLIAMLANDPDLLILDEPTNHLDLPSIEELETALQKYTGAILYVSHDNYFRDKIGGDIVGVHSLSGMV